MVRWSGGSEAAKNERVKSKEGRKRSINGRRGEMECKGVKRRRGSEKGGDKEGGKEELQNMN